MFVGDGYRKFYPAGTPCSPTEQQVKNMPDLYAPIDGSAPAAEKTSHGLRGMSIGSIKEKIKKIDDVETLDEYMAEEESGRNRKGALEAIRSRLDDLTAPDSDGE